MTYKTIKISEKNYGMLLKESSLLQQKYGKKVTFDDAISELAKKKQNLSSCFGKLSDESARKMEQVIETMVWREKK